MPRDCAPQPLAEVALPGGRRGRIVPADAAGQFRVQLVGTTWIDRLAGLGWLTRNQVETAERLRDLFEASAMRPGLTGSYSPSIDGGTFDFALERLDADQLRAWRRLSNLLSAASPGARAVVVACALWDQRPCSVRLLQAGLDAIAAALGLGRRR